MEEDQSKSLNTIVKQLKVLNERNIQVDKATQGIRPVGRRKQRQKQDAKILGAELFSATNGTKSADVKARWDQEVGQAEIQTESNTSKMAQQLADHRDLMIEHHGRSSRLSQWLNSFQVYQSVKRDAADSDSQKSFKMSQHMANQNYVLLEMVNQQLGNIHSTLLKESPAQARARQEHIKNSRHANLNREAALDASFDRLVAKNKLQKGWNIPFVSKKQNSVQTHSDLSQQRQRLKDDIESTKLPKQLRIFKKRRLEKLDDLLDQILKDGKESSLTARVSVARKGVKSGFKSNNLTEDEIAKINAMRGDKDTKALGRLFGDDAKQGQLDMSMLQSKEGRRSLYDLGPGGKSIGGMTECCDSLKELVGYAKTDDARDTRQEKREIKAEGWALEAKRDNLKEGTSKSDPMGIGGNKTNADGGGSVLDSVMGMLQVAGFVTGGGVTALTAKAIADKVKKAAARKAAELAAKEAAMKKVKGSFISRIKKIVEKKGTDFALKLLTKHVGKVAALGILQLAVPTPGYPIQAFIAFGFLAWTVYDVMKAIDEMEAIMADEANGISPKQRLQMNAAAKLKNDQTQFDNYEGAADADPTNKHWQKGSDTIMYPTSPGEGWKEIPMPIRPGEEDIPQIDEELHKQLTANSANSIGTSHSGSPLQANYGSLMATRAYAAGLGLPHMIDGSNSLLRPATIGPREETPQETRDREYAANAAKEKPKIKEIATIVAAVIKDPQLKKKPMIDFKRIMQTKQAYNQGFSGMNDFMHGMVNQNTSSGFMGFNPVRKMAHGQVSNIMGQFKNPDNVTPELISSTRAMIANKAGDMLGPEKTRTILERFDQFAKTFKAYNDSKNQDLIDGIDSVTPDKSKADELANAGLHKGSIYTHDVHLEKLLTMMNNNNNDHGYDENDKDGAGFFGKPGKKKPRTEEEKKRIKEQIEKSRKILGFDKPTTSEMIAGGTAASIPFLVKEMMAQRSTDILKIRTFMGQNAMAGGGMGPGNPHLSASQWGQTRGSKIPNSLFEQASGQKGSTYKWLTARTNPGHFGPVEQAIKGLKFLASVPFQGLMALIYSGDAGAGSDQPNYSHVPNWHNLTPMSNNDEQQQAPIIITNNNSNVSNGSTAVMMPSNAHAPGMPAGLNAI